ncbi:MAG: glutathione-disulfide reductase [Limibacillus sp.]
MGAGTGVVRGERMAASTGAKVGIAEEFRYGGTCVIRGCVPKKLMVYASHFSEEFEDAAGYGWTLSGEATFDWKTLIANKDKEIERLEGIYRKLLTAAGVTMHDGHARLIDNHTVEVAGERCTAETILLATGGAPVLPREPGAEYGISSNEIFHLEEQPRHIVIAGGGYIAVEFAGIMNGLGSEVTLIYRGPKVLRGFDEDLRDGLMVELREKGVRVITEQIISRTEKKDGRLALTLSKGEELLADQVLYAIGRDPNTKGIGLEEAGVELTGSGAVKVDEFSRTSQPNIYAVGDVTERVNLTPVAIQEAMAFVDTVYRGKPRGLDHENIPMAVFSQPPIGSVGMSEERARQAVGEVEIYRSSFRAMKHTLSGRQEKSTMKLVVDKNTRKVLGAHMLGADAAEIIQGIGIAVKMGATKEDFDATVGIHPTSAEEFVTMREPISD